MLGIDPVYWRFFRGLLFAYLGFVLLIYLVQRRLQYFPDGSPVARPLGEDLKTLEEVTLQAADGVRIRAWYWPGVRPDNILMFHGNAGHRGHRSRLGSRISRTGIRSLPPGLSGVWRQRRIAHRGGVLS